MSTYRKADTEVEEIANVLLKLHFPELIEAGLRIGYLSAHARRNQDDKPSGPALKLRGMACCATVRTTTQEDRAAGHPDCIITVDGDKWGEWSASKKRAVLCHELYHISLRIKGSIVQRDGSGRPKLRLKEHDLVVGGFSRLVELYPGVAVEQAHYESVKKEMARLGQA